MKNLGISQLFKDLFCFEFKQRCDPPSNLRMIHLAEEFKAYCFHRVAMPFQINLHYNFVAWGVFVHFRLFPLCIAIRRD